MRKPFVCYAVSRGRAVGIFDTWATCAASVRGFGPAARYRGFYSRQDAEEWLLDERAKLEEARRGRKKGRHKAEDTDGCWHFIPATEPLEGPAIPEWKQQETSAGGTDQAARKC